MGTFINWVGKRFDKLEIIARGEDHIRKSGKHVTTWICKCDCGNIKTIDRNSLNNGRAKSCGCSRSKIRAINIEGKKFGKLNVISLHHTDKNRSFWLCNANVEIWLFREETR